jgi:hypothetical protein
VINVSHSPRRTPSPLKKLNRDTDGRRNAIEFCVKSRQSLQHIGIRFNAMLDEKRHPIGDTGYDQIGDKRVRIHSYALTVYALQPGAIDAYQNDHLTARVKQSRRNIRAPARWRAHQSMKTLSPFNKPRAFGDFGLIDRRNRTERNRGKRASSNGSN